MEARPFTLVLAGGGARGYAHVGVLRGLEAMGLAPVGIVGVSMGAIAAVTYAVREDWYPALLTLDTHGAPAPHHPEDGRDHHVAPSVRRAWRGARTAWCMLTGWGAPTGAISAGRAALESLIGSARLEEGRVPVAACATDLLSGVRVILDRGPALPAVLASASLAGVLPPVEIGSWLLADGVYADIAPVDVAREMGAPVVIAVDPTQDVPVDSIGNGLQAVMRAMDICHLAHAHLRIDEADFVLRPHFDRFVDVLDFDARRTCVAAGIRAVRDSRDSLQALL